MKTFRLILSFFIIVTIVVWAGVFAHFKADSVKNPQLEMYFLNVGQGDSEYIKTPSGEDILIDGGSDNSVLTELGKAMDFGDREINLVVLTHPHADHIAGLVEVLKRYQVDEIYESGVDYPSAVYDQWKQEVKDLKIKDTFVKVGDTQNFGQTKITVLSPTLDLKNQTMDNVNNASVVTEIDYQNFTSLFLGDAEISAQDQFLNSIHHYNLIKVAHHGSSNGLDEKLLRIAEPNIAVIEVGKGNTYGHPANVTIDFLKSLACQIYRTDQDKTVELTSDGYGFKVN